MNKRRDRRRWVCSINQEAAMLKNYFTTAFGDVLWQKGYAFINVAGLSIGLVCRVLPQKNGGEVGI
jgi:hypothetical protein